MSQFTLTRQLNSMLLGLIVLCVLGVANYAQAAEKVVISDAEAARLVEAGVPTNGPNIREAKEGEHPLAPVIEWAEEQLEKSKWLESYSATMTKRQRIRGRLTSEQVLRMDLQEEPKSIVVKLVKAGKNTGVQLYYNEAMSKNALWVTPTGMAARLVGTVKLSTTHRRVMEGERYPITNSGLRRLVELLIKQSEAAFKADDCEVAIDKKVQVGNRECTLITVTLPTEQSFLLSHQVKIYVDNQFGLPVKLQSYLWPDANGNLPLDEEYAYTDLRLNPTEFDSSTFSKSAFVAKRRRTVSNTIVR